MSPDQQKVLQEIVSGLGRYLGPRAKAEFFKAGEIDLARVNLVVAEPSLLLGDSGGNLVALQHLIRIIFRKKTGVAAGFTLDINNYRLERQKYLSDLALDMAQKVAEENRLVILKPMNSYERRIVHLALACDPRVATESLGEAEERRVIIKPQNK